MSDPVNDLKHELLGAAERRQGDATASAGHGRVRGHGGRRRFLVTTATLFAAAAVALLFASPWSDSPSFLARAEAALTPPAGMILHETWDTTTTSTDPHCTVDRGPNEIWIDGTPPHRYRLRSDDFPPARGPIAVACASGTAVELGGMLGQAPTLRFVPPNTLIAVKLRYRRELDPATKLREAIKAGTAHHEGQTRVDGRTVERIRIDPPAWCPGHPCSREPGYAYVDPETFYPVRTEGPGAIGVVGGSAVIHLHVVERVVTFEYLRRTEANRALTDIRAQHPNATGP